MAGVENLTKVGGVSFSDISAWLDGRGVKPIEESKLGAKNFLLRYIELYSIEKILLEAKFGAPHEIVNGFARYRARLTKTGSQETMLEDTYIKYIRYGDADTGVR